MAAPTNAPYPPGPRSAPVVDRGAVSGPRTPDEWPMLFGNPRRFFYDGPFIPDALKRSDIQIPIEAVHESQQEKN